MKYSYARASKPMTAPVPDRMAVMYLRVSSKEQEVEGFSIPAQRRLLEAYAAKEGLRVVEAYEDVETAKRTGRKSFQAMLTYLKSHPEVRHVLVEKTDRLYRNFGDYSVLDDLKLDVHLVKEGEVLNEGSRSHQKLVHGFKVLMAKNYVDNLSEEVTKGLAEKSEAGYFPGKAPAGYINDRNSRNLILDPDRAPIIRKAFELYAGGEYSISDIRKVMIDAGFTQRSTGKPPLRSQVEYILKNPIYYGDHRWKGRIHEGGKNPTIISRALFDRVQSVLVGKKPGVYQERRFAFGQMLTCGHCGCTITAEIKKERYIYYRCSHGKGKCVQQKAVREEVLSQQLGEVLAAIKLDSRVAALIEEAIGDSSAEQEAYHREQVARLQGEIGRFKARLEQMYLDKLDGQIDEAFWKKQSATCRDRIAAAETELAAHQVADDRTKDLARQTLELAQSAHRQFIQENPHEQRRLLQYVLSNCFLSAGKVEPEYRKPFSLLAYAAKHLTPQKNDSGPEDPESSIRWR